MKPRTGGADRAPEHGAEPVRNAMSDRVYALLRSQIIDLDLQPGARLRIERLSAQFDVSPSPVREALSRLSAEGLVTAEPYRGFRVSDLLDRTELAQLLRARCVIEDTAARQAALLRDAAALERLREYVDHMDHLIVQRDFDVKAFNATDAAFHRLIVETSGNPFLLVAFDSLHSHVQIARHFQGRSVADAERSNGEHRGLLDALAARDAEGTGERVVAHLDGVAERLRTEDDASSEWIDETVGGTR